MFSRLVCTVGRLAPATGRAGLWRHLSTCQPRLSNDTPNPVSTSGRTGLTSFLEGKTGVTGAGTLGVGVAAYLLSKEIYIINNETVVAVVMGGVLYYLLSKVGSPITQYIDDRNQKIQDKFYGYHNAQIQEVEDAITDQHRLDGNLEVRHDIFSVLRENNVMQMEEEYRRRWHEVTTEVTRRLDYQLEVQKVQTSFQHSHMVQWLEKAVIDNIKGQEDASINRCITDLKKLAVA